MKLYHITKIDNVDSILADGLKKKGGYIFLFENENTPYCEGFYRRDKWSNNMRMFSVVDIIAKNEIFLSEYALFEIDVDGLPLEKDVCGESIDCYQKKTNADISNDKIKYIGNFKTKHFWDFPLLEGKYRPVGKIIKLPQKMGFIECA